MAQKVLWRGYNLTKGSNVGQVNSSNRLYITPPPLPVPPEPPSPPINDLAFLRGVFSKTQNGNINFPNTPTNLDLSGLSTTGSVGSLAPLPPTMFFNGSTALTNLPLMTAFPNPLPAPPDPPTPFTCPLSICNAPLLPRGTVLQTQAFVQSTFSTVFIAGWIGNIYDTTNFVFFNPNAEPIFCFQFQGTGAYFTIPLGDSTINIPKLYLQHFIFMSSGMHSFAFSMDYTTNVAQLVIDQNTFTFVNISWHDTGPFTSTSPITGVIQSGNCELGQLMISLGQPFFDLSVTANINKLFGTDNTAQNWGSDGSLPTGTQPTLYFEGDASQYLTNNGSAGGELTVYGSIIDSEIFANIPTPYNTSYPVITISPTSYRLYINQTISISMSVSQTNTLPGEVYSTTFSISNGSIDYTGLLINVDLTTLNDTLATLTYTSPTTVGTYTAHISVTNSFGISQTAILIFTILPSAPSGTGAVSLISGSDTYGILTSGNLKISDPTFVNNFLIAGWLGYFGGTQLDFINNSVSGPPGINFQLTSNGATASIFMIAFDQDSNEIFEAGYPLGYFISNLTTGWHSFAASVDIPTQRIQIMIDLTLHDTINGVGGGDDLYWYSTNPIYFEPIGVDEPSNYWTLTVQGGSEGIKSGMYDFRFGVNEGFFDLSNTSNVSKIFTTDNLIVSWGANGSLITGSVPLIFLHGNESTYPNNLGSDASFTVTDGTLSDIAGPL